jgi:hypothetical protein
MQKTKTKNGDQREYVAPELAVAHVRLEKFLAVSHLPIVTAVGVEYTMYDDAVPEMGDVLLY